MDSSARRVLLVVAWMFFGFSVGMFTVVAAAIADNRSLDLTPRPNLLTGPLAVLPYLLPTVLLILGLGAYARITRTGRPGDAWGRVQTGFLVMMALFEANAVTGLVLFALGEPIRTFFLFAVITCLLFAVGLWRLLTTWPAD